MADAEGSIVSASLLHRSARRGCIRVPRLTIVQHFNLNQELIWRVSGTLRTPEEILIMQKLMFGALAAATIAMATPASSQGVYVGDGRGGGPDVSIRVGPGHPGYRARATARCKMVVTRSVRPDGTRVTKRVQRCR